MQFSVKGGLETTKLKVSLMVGLVLDVSMSCVSNSLSSQVNLYVPGITTGNANAANEDVTIGQVCAPLQKYARP